MVLCISCCSAPFVVAAGLSRVYLVAAAVATCCCGLIRCGGLGPRCCFAALTWALCGCVDVQHSLLLLHMSGFWCTRCSGLLLVCVPFPAAALCACLNGASCMQGCRWCTRLWERPFVTMMCDCVVMMAWPCMWSCGCSLCVGCVLVPGEV